MVVKRTRRGRLTRWLGWLWEIPLALASWIFFHLTKLLLSRVYSYALAKMPHEARIWKVFSEQTLSQPLVLPIVATKGPRWNTHAVIATAGPIEVRRSASFRVATAARSASSWSIVLYAVPGYRTVASVKSFDVAAEAEWHEVELAPGRYSVNLRYYQLRDGAETPEVKADGIRVIRSQWVPPGNNDFYRQLRRRDSWFYAALHYYVFPMLRFRRWLPESFVRREYLPVGDPGTHFRYGFLRAGAALHVDSDPELFRSYDLYLTVYDRSSFPVLSERIREPAYRTPPAEVDGFYLVRIRRKAVVVEELRDDQPRIEAV